jgi:hypothetical protein
MPTRSALPERDMPFRAWPHLAASARPRQSTPHQARPPWAHLISHTRPRPVRPDQTAPDSPNHISLASRALLNRPWLTAPRLISRSKPRPLRPSHAATSLPHQPDQYTTRLPLHDQPSHVSLAATHLAAPSRAFPHPTHQNLPRRAEPCRISRARTCRAVPNRAPPATPYPPHHAAICGGLGRRRDATLAARPSIETIMASISDERPSVPATAAARFNA